VSTANLTRREAEVRSAAIHLHAYDIDLDLSGAPDPSIQGFGTTTTITFEWNASGAAPETFCDFLGTGVDEVTVNGEARPVDEVWDGHRIALRDLTAGVDRVVIRGTAAYSRTGQGLHRFVDPADGQTYVYSHLEPADARRVFATFEQPDLKAPVTLHVTAPSAWSVIANQPAHREEEAGPGLTRTEFRPTPPLSTYLVAICAGPWFHVDDHWSRPQGAATLEVPLGLWCRSSLADHLDAEDLFRVTRQGLDHYHEIFGFPYPWGKYDQLFAPEYNIGAMENPGCVTLNEKFLHRDRPTRADLTGRAIVVLHEMAHMWFGDLVTPAWWDDLWLKESFAEYMGHAVAGEATEYTDAWVSFAGSRKEWAYVADQLPTTHPIAADIADLEAAKQNFDGITYAKGAAVLKQLVAYVGRDAFLAGSRRYFDRHAFGAARLVDLLDALAEASGRDLRTWAAQWLETAGPDRLEAVLGGSGEETTISVVRTSPDQARRPHRLAVGCYRPGPGGLTRTERVETDLIGDRIDTSIVSGDGPRLILPNDDDLTYAATRLDVFSRATALDRLGEMTDPLAQAQAWSALWGDVRDARLGAPAYLRAVLTHAGRLTGRDDPAAATLLPSLLARSASAVGDYLPEGMREAARADAFDAAWQRLQHAVPGSDAQLAWARGLARLAPGAEPEAVEGIATRLGILLDGPAPVGLDVGPDLRWEIVIALSALGQMTEEDLAGELAADPSAQGRVQRLTAFTAQPLVEIGDWAWAELQRRPLEWSNEEIRAVLAGMSLPVPRLFVTAHADAYWAGLADTWQQLPIEIATRLVEGLFPAVEGVELDADPADDDVVTAARGWLDSHPEAPGALRRLILERADLARRHVRAQQLVLEQAGGEG